MGNGGKRKNGVGAQREFWGRETRVGGKKNLREKSKVAGGEEYGRREKKWVCEGRWRRKRKREEGEKNNNKKNKKINK